MTMTTTPNHHQEIARTIAQSALLHPGWAPADHLSYLEHDAFLINGADDRALAEALLGTTAAQTLPAARWTQTRNGQWVVVGPTATVQPGVVTVTKRDGSTESVTVESVGKTFAIEGIPSCYGYVSERAVTPKESSSPATAEGYYRHDNEVFVVVKAKTTGRNYAKRLVIRTSYSGSKTAKWDYEPGAVYKLEHLVPLTVEDAARLGHLHGFCVVCASALTDPVSVSRGIGPVCAKRLAR